MTDYTTPYHRYRTFTLFMATALLFLGFGSLAWADSPATVQPQAEFIYTVQPGDTLILVAFRHNLNPAEIALVNNLSPLNLISPGQRLILPGVAEVTSEATPTSLPVPTYGSETIHVVQAGETMVSIANLYGVSVDDLLRLNTIQNPNQIAAGQALQIPPGSTSAVALLDSAFESINLSEPIIIQGRTLVLKVTVAEGATLSGIFEGKPLRFYHSGLNQFWSIIPIHALFTPQTYPLSLLATLPDGSQSTHVEHVTILEGPYGLENIQVDTTQNGLLDADLLALEQQKLMDVWSQITLQPRWEGPFWYPLAVDQSHITSYFGTRRTYNYSEQLSFHSGTDFSGGVGVPFYAPAAGRVVMVEPLTVRGNVVLIDHGWGLYSGFWHQDYSVVSVGQEIQQGDLIGYVGNTGLVTGPHLHWELRLNGVAVNPVQWLNESLP